MIYKEPCSQFLLNTSLRRCSQKLPWLYCKAAKLSMAMQRLSQWCSFNFSYRLHLFRPSQKVNGKQAEVLLVESENTFLWHKISEKQTRGCSHILHLLFIFLSFFSSGTKSTLSSPLHEHIPASVCPDRWASGVCHIKTPRPKPTADEAHMFLQWKDITDFTLTCLCLLNPLAWYLIFGAILGRSLGFAAKGLYCKLWSHHSSVPHSRTLDYVNLCK